MKNFSMNDRIYQSSIIAAPRASSDERLYLVPIIIPPRPHSLN